MTNNQKSPSARERIEKAGRAPILGWAQDRKINLLKTDVRETFKQILAARNGVKQ